MRGAYPVYQIVNSFHGHLREFGIIQGSQLCNLFEPSQEIKVIYNIQTKDSLLVWCSHLLSVTLVGLFLLNSVGMANFRLQLKRRNDVYTKIPSWVVNSIGTAISANSSANR